jgi:Fe-S oxidoreductase
MFLSEKERDETIRACRFCMMCHCADRVGQVVRRESYTPRGRGAIIFGLDEGLLDYDEGVADIMYTTLNDRRIQHWCVGNYDHEELVIDTRARIFEKGRAPEDVIAYARNLRNDPVQGGDPAKILSEAGVMLDSDADTLLFCGRAARDSQQATLIAAGKLFNRAGQGFKVLADEPSSGWALYQLGDFEGAKKLSMLLAEKIRASSVSTVVALDADAYRMLMGRTTRFGGDLKGVKILHVNAVMAGWLRDNRIAAAHRISDPVTYHDPCVLARDFEDIESPRFILSQILDSGFQEMATSKKLANCCGAGGMLAVHRADVSEDVALMRLDEAKETGAALLVSGCPRCDETFEKAMAARGPEDIRVVNLVELVAEAVGTEE